MCKLEITFFKIIFITCKQSQICQYYGKDVEFPLIKNIFSELFEKLKISDYSGNLKVSDYKEKSESFRLQREI